MQIKTITGDELPVYFDFLLQLGMSAAANSESDAFYVLTLPTLRFASQMFALGALFEIWKSGAIGKRVEPSSLDTGDYVTWLTADKMHVRCGIFMGIPDESSRGPVFKLEPIGENAQNFRQLEKFDEYKFAPYYGLPFRHPRKLSRNLEIIAKFSDGDEIDLTTQSRNEICLIGGPRLKSELLTPAFLIDGVAGCGDDLLRVEGLYDVEESPHYLSRFVKTMSQKIDDPNSPLAIFDGAAAYQRHGNFVTASTKVVILDRWDKNSIDVAVKLNKIQSKSQIEPIKLRRTKVPLGIELNAWRVRGS